VLGSWTHKLQQYTKLMGVKGVAHCEFTHISHEGITEPGKVLGPDGFFFFSFLFSFFRSFFFPLFLSFSAHTHSHSLFNFIILLKMIKRNSLCLSGQRLLRIYGPHSAPTQHLTEYNEVMICTSGKKWRKKQKKCVVCCVVCCVSCGERGEERRRV